MKVEDGINISTRDRRVYFLVSNDKDGNEDTGRHFGNFYIKFRKMYLTINTCYQKLVNRRSYLGSLS